MPGDIVAPPPAEHSSPLDPPRATDARPVGNASARQLARNFGAGYLGMIGSVVLSLVLTPVVLAHLGASGYGLWILVTTVGTYVGLLGAGVGIAALRQVAADTALGNLDRVADVLATTRAFFAASGLAAMVLTCAFVPFVGDVFSLSHGLLSAARWGLVLTGLFTVVGFLASVPGSAISGSGLSDRAAVISLAVNVGTQAAQVVVVVLGGGVVALVATTVVGTALGWVAAEAVARRLGVLRPGRASRALLRELTRSGLRNAAVSVGGAITYGLDTFVIGAVLPIRKVAPYDLALATANFTRGFASGATNLLLPTYAHSDALDDRERQFRLFTRAVAASLAITASMAVALIGFGRPLLRLWLHHVPAQTYQVLVVINIVYFLQLPGHQAFLYLTGVGRNRLLARAALPLALFNLSSSVVATFLFGAVGPAVGDLPQVLVFDFLLLPLFSCRIMGRRFGGYLRAGVLPVLASLVIAAGLTIALRLALPAPPLLAAPAEAVAVTVTSLTATVLVLVWVDPDLRVTLRRLRLRLRPQQDHG